jgi:predicted Zn-dependent protease
MRWLLVFTLFANAFTTPAYAFDFGEAVKAIDDLQKNKNTTENTESQKDAVTTSQTTGINLLNPSRAEEIAIGREITGNLLGAAPLVKDTGLQQYVNQVGRWVASQSERPDLPWHFGVIESEDINAFAAPGGYVLITKGLYRRLDNEAQLAGVLGHEIGHVVKKHHLKLLQQSQLLGMGANLLNQKAAKDNQTVQKMIGSGAEILARGLDKDAEFEADRLGLTLATRSGYDAYGLPEVLTKLSSINGNDDSVTLLFKTHPAPDDRLEKLANAVGSSLDKLPEGKTLAKRLYPLKQD